MCLLQRWAGSFRRLEMRLFVCTLIFDQLFIMTEIFILYEWLYYNLVLPAIFFEVNLTIIKTFDFQLDFQKLPLVLSYSLSSFMLKSLTSSKRPLPNTTLPLNDSHTHKCYFHDSYFISKFCTNKKCTLPLCEKCIPIHVKQHLKEEHIIGKENIVPFSEAYDFAVQNLQALITAKTQKTASIREQLESTRKQIEGIIQKQFSKIQELISSQQNDIKLITEKFTKITKGSLKTLIFYFSDEEKIKSNTETFRLQQSSLSQIPLLIQKLKNTLNCFFQNQSIKQNCINTSNPVRQTSQPKHDNYSLKNYSSSFLGTSSNINNLIIQPVANILSSNKEKPENNQPKKFQSSSDFSSLLKDHKSRLQSVRNKNFSFATNYASQNQQTVYEKPGSKSVDNFYFTRSTREQSQYKGESESRPLQVVSKNFNNVSVKWMSPKKPDLNSDSQQKLSKIKQKYIGDISLSKENGKNKTLAQYPKSQTMKESKYSSKNTPIHGLKGEQTQGNKAVELDNRILSRQEIRVNIQNRLNQRSISLLAPNEKEKTELTRTYLPSQGKSQTLDQKIKLQTSKQHFGKEKIEQFTLNKNYQRGQSYRTVTTEMQKVPMSSIKRELRAQLFEQHAPATKKFFEDNSEKLESFDVRDEKLSKTNDILKIKHEITDFVLEKKPVEDGEIRKAKIIHRQNLKDEPSKKDLMYDQAKQSIKLNEPNSRSQKENRQNSESKRKEGRRFNYLYEVSQESEITSTQKN